MNNKKNYIKNKTFFFFMIMHFFIFWFICHFDIWDIGRLVPIKHLIILIFCLRTIIYILDPIIIFILLDIIILITSIFSKNKSKKLKKYINTNNKSIIYWLKVIKHIIVFLILICSGYKLLILYYNVILK